MHIDFFQFHSNTLECMLKFFRKGQVIPKSQSLSKLGSFAKSSSSRVALYPILKLPILPGVRLLLIQYTCVRGGDMTTHQRFSLFFHTKQPYN